MPLLFETGGTPLLWQDRVPASEAALYGARPSGN